MTDNSTEPLYLRLSVHYVAINLAPGPFAFRSELRTVQFDNPIVTSVLRAIVPLLDGSRSVQQVLKECEVKEVLAIAVLRLMADNRLLEEVPRDAFPDGERFRTAGYLQQTALYPEESLRHLRDARPWVIGTGDLPWLLIEALAECDVLAGSVTVFCGGTHKAVAGWDVKRLPWQVDELSAAFEYTTLIITALDRLWYPLLELVNKAVLAAKRLWLPVLLQGDRGTLGPTLRPYESACFTCFDLRLRGNLAEPDLYDSFVSRQSAEMLPPAAVTIPAFRRVIASQAAMEAYKLLADCLLLPETVGRLIEFRLADVRVLRQMVLKLPRCPSCGRQSPPAQLWDEFSIERLANNGLMGLSRESRISVLSRGSEPG
jgi:bacteriocin biosynthesis cyclodehydratase domain-containing protein